MASKLRTGPIRILPNTDGSQVNPLELANKANTHAVTIQSPDTLSADNKIVMPGADGTNGQVVKTDGAGNWGFTTVSGGGGGGVNLQTSSYTLVSGDAGKNVIFNISTAATATLPATPPSSTWTATISNEATSSGILTIATSSANIDGAPGPLPPLCATQGISIWTDGTNYFTSRGGPLPGSTIIADTSTLTTTGGALLTLRDTSGNTLGGPVLSVVSNAVVGLDISMVNSTTTGGNAAVGVIAGSSTEVGSIAVQGVGILSGGTVGGQGGYFLAEGTAPALTAYSMQAGSGAVAFVCHGAMSLVPILYANRPPTPSAGFVFFCSDGKNFHTDGNAVGTPLVSGGTGCLALYQNGGWVTMS